MARCPLKRIPAALCGIAFLSLGTGCGHGGSETVPAAPATPQPGAQQQFATQAASGRAADAQKAAAAMAKTPHP